MFPSVKHSEIEFVCVSELKVPLSLRVCQDLFIKMDASMLLSTTRSSLSTGSPYCAPTPLTTTRECGSASPMGTHVCVHVPLFHIPILDGERGLMLLLLPSFTHPSAPDAYECLMARTSAHTCLHSRTHVIQPDARSINMSLSLSLSPATVNENFCPEFKMNNLISREYETTPLRAGACVLGVKCEAHLCAYVEAS